MSLKEKYGIVFYSQIISGVKYNTCNVTDSNYYNLSFISCFDSTETSQMIGDLNNCITYQYNISDTYESDSIENIHIIEYQYPNMLIDNIVTIPMTDLKELLQEWLTYLNS